MQQNKTEGRSFAAVSDIMNPMRINRLPADWKQGIA